MEILEREAEVARLLAAVAAAEAGRGALVLVAGEAGIGKTTLVRLLRDQVRGRARTVVVGCEPLSVPEPLGPFHDLSTAIAGLDDALATADAPALARALCASCTETTVVASRTRTGPMRSPSTCCGCSPVASTPSRSSSS